jgi:osmotically-inducible protein OsmY
MNASGNHATNTGPSNNASANSGNNGAGADTAATLPTNGNAAALPAQSPPVSDYAADNSRVNARDRNGSTLTPMDQGSSEADRKLTQQIRQAVVADKSLSFTAKNVKIITINGKVTLRGTVKTDDERTKVASAAKRIAGDAQVESYLEVAK